MSFQQVNAQFTTLQRTYGDSTHDLGWGITTSDNGMLFAFTQNPYQPTSHVILLKTDSLGNEIWSKNFGDSVEPVEFRGLIPTRDTGCILSLWIGSSNFAIALLKIDPSGNIIWTKPGSILCGYQDYSGGYIALGGNGRGKFDSQGNYMGYIHYGDSGDVNPGAGIETKDSGSVIIGITRNYASGGPGDWDGFIARTDSSGNLLWAKAIGTDSLEQFIGVDETFDGGFIIVGKTKASGVAGYNDIWLVKVDANGNVQWSKMYGGASDDRGIYVKQTNGSPGYILAGQSFGNETIFPGERSFAYKVDFNGNFQWGKIYGDVSNGSPGADVIQFVDETLEGGYLMTGSTGSFGAGMYDVWCIRTDNLGSSGCNEVNTTPTVSTPTLNVVNITTSQIGTATYPPLLPFEQIIPNFTAQVLCSNPPGLGIEDLKSEDHISIFPNPTPGAVTIRLDDLKGGSQITFYNCLGQEVFSRKENSNEFSVDLSIFPSGIYLVNIINKGKLFSKKIIKE
jgi:hypothetical protein